MKKVGEILANSIENLYKKGRESGGYHAATANADEIKRYSREELERLYAIISFDIVDIVYNLGKIDDYIKFVQANKEVQG